jgi:hypothetical protein
MRKRLFSYHFVSTDSTIHSGFTHIGNIYPDFEVMMDSGAFTVKMQGAVIDIEKYAEFLLQYKDWITVMVGLDVISSERTPQALERGAQEGWDNLKYLESKGLNILHTYHSGEDEKWLKKLMDNYEYFAVSKTGDVAGVEERLNRIFSKLVDKHGRIHHKIHGFGVTSPKMMMRYPWASVDSSSWVKYGCYGVCIMFINGKFKSIGMSDRKLTLWSKKGGHYNNLNREERKVWDMEMEKRGFTRDDLQDNRTRDMWNLESFIQLENWISTQEITFKPRKDLFSL